MRPALARKKKNLPSLVRLRADPSWADRVDRHAHRAGVSRSEFIRRAVTAAMDQAEAAGGARGREKK